MPKHTFTRTIQVRSEWMEENSRGGKTRRYGPWKNHHIEITIDLDSIAQHMGAKAVRSKGKRSRGLNGDVVVKVAR